MAGVEEAHAMNIGEAACQRTAVEAKKSTSSPIPLEFNIERSVVREIEIASPVRSLRELLGRTHR